MQKVFIICFLVISSLFSGSILGKYLTLYDVLGREESSQIQQAPSPSSIKIGRPVSLQIPKLGIYALIDPVGLEQGGKMGVPENADIVGWYSLGSRPGDNGNAVLAGHYDTVAGTPAIFYDLSKLEAGDLITVVDENGKQILFRVTEREVYPFNDFPLDSIFGHSTQKRLNLITCEGRFDSLSQNYSHRTVVYSEFLSF